MKNYTHLPLLVLALTAFHINIATAQTLTTNTTIDLDYCREKFKVVLSLINLPADATEIKWYQIDVENKLTQVAKGGSEYISRIAMRYYATFKSGGVLYKTAVVKTGIELVKNGDFELGPTTEGKNSFITQYVFGVGAAGKYNILQDAKVFYDEFKGKYDHTKDDGSGYFMVVDGVSGKTVWRQNIAVQPNTTYYLSAWALKIYQTKTTVTDENPLLGFSVNGVDIGKRVLLTQWTKDDRNPWLDDYRFYATWNSGSSTTATVTIVNYNNNSNGNDFGLDDISFGTFAPPAINIDGLNGNDKVCEGIPLHITPNVSGGCSNEFEYQWVNHTDPSHPVVMSTSDHLDIDYPTIAKHGGEWKLTIKDLYSTDTYSFHLDLLTVPEITFNTTCVTKDREGKENKNGSITIAGDGTAMYRLLDSHAQEVGGGWSSTNLQYKNLGTGTYTIEAKHVDSRQNACASSAEVTLDSKMFIILPPDEICQGEEASFTVAPSLCCYAWSNKRQSFLQGCIDAGQTYLMGGTLFENSLVKGANAYGSAPAQRVSYRQVGVFRLEAANDYLLLEDDGMSGFSYSIYEYPFNPQRPAENFIVRVNTNSTMSKSQRAIRKLVVGKHYVVVANAPSAATACHSDLSFAEARQMIAAPFPEINWYSDAAATIKVGSGASISSKILFPSGTNTPGIYDFFVSCCNAGCGADKVTITINPTPVINPNQTICSGSSTDIQPIVLDKNGNEIDEALFSIEYKWEVISKSGVNNTGISNSAGYQSAMTQTITLQSAYACGEVKYAVTARVGGAEYGCESNTTTVAVRVVDLSKIKTLDEINVWVDRLEAASWNELAEPNSDIKEERPKYKQFKNGDTTLDFSTSAIPNQVCYTELMNSFEWWIAKDSDPSSIIYSGIAQPSKELVGGNIIQIELDDPEQNAFYTIYYRLQVICGDELVVLSRPIVLKPRPIMRKTLKP